MFPEIVLHMMILPLNDRLRVSSEEEFFVEEQRTGLSRLKKTPDQAHVIWNWGFKDFQHSTTKVNKFLTRIAYVRRRFAFAKQINQRMLDILDELQTYEFTNSEITKILRSWRIERKERLLNQLAQLESYEHQSECMQKRADNLITVVSSKRELSYSGPLV
jgi:hypothetical protein